MGMRLGQLNMVSDSPSNPAQIEAVQEAVATVAQRSVGIEEGSCLH